MIAIDAMGGDFAPTAIVQGALLSAKTTHIKLCLFGPKGELERMLTDLDPAWESYSLSVVDAPQVIEMGEEPVQALRQKRNSSLVRAVEAVAKGECTAVLSAGNSGAIMAAALFFIGRTQGVLRPALVGLLPAQHGPVVCLDLGANADCKPENLYQFAQLGIQYASDVLKIKNPSVGLLSNGEEPGKGSLLTKGAFALMQELPGFVGNVEPGHVFSNKVDIVVCDGFVGNVLLKTCEALFAWFSKEVGNQSGALLLGIQKPTIIVHGNASAHTIAFAIKFAYDVSLNLNVARYIAGENL